MDRTDELHRLGALYVPLGSSSSSTSATNLRLSSGKSNNIDRNVDLTSSRSRRNGNESRYVFIARRVVTNIDGNEALVRRMEKLSTRKEFSNDPTQEMTEISDLFHMKVALIQTDFQLLKQMTDVKVQVSEGQHQIQHYKLMMQTLNKRHLVHVDAFKTALKVHSENVKQRQKRVGKYGQGQDQVRAAMVGIGSGMQQSAPQGSSFAATSSTPSSSSGPLYAMFSNPHQSKVEVQLPQELRRRGNVPAPAGGGGLVPSSVASDAASINADSSVGSGSAVGGRGPPNPSGGLAGVFKAGPPKSAFVNGKPLQYQQQYHNSRQSGSYVCSQYGSNQGYPGGNGGGGYMQMQLHQSAPGHHTAQASRLKSAEQVEKSIVQMGHLFSQMATLVMEQSETIARIEDDVEIGLEDTKEAHASMEQFYEISKGNRSLIIKVFVLLIFFLFLFLVWT